MREMWKKSLAVGLAGILVAASVSGCGFSPSDSGESSSDAGKSAKSKKEINVMMWDATYPEDVFDEFEDKTGIKVNTTFITDTNEELTKLVDGSNHYDYVDIESAYVKTFVDNDILQELDYSKIPNAKLVDERYKGAPGDEEGKYTTPMSSYLYTYIVYNRETCPIQITSVQDLADPALKGRICLINSSISLYGTALTALGYPADSTDEKQISEANDLLAKIKPNVLSFAGASAMSQLENGDCDVALCWDYPALMLNPDCRDKYAVAPITTGYERSNGFGGIPKNADNPEGGEAFIDFMNSPEIQGEICMDEMVGGNPPLLTKDAMKEQIDDSYYDSPTIQAADQFYDSSWRIAINDDQMSLIDTYYTNLMSN